MNPAAFKNIGQDQSGTQNRIVAAVQRAASRTGVDFSFLMKKAETESSLDPKAQAKTSSARGLFQFIESTWLSMVKQHGARFGLGDLAEKIDMRGGKPCVDDCDLRDKILALRDDPEISALMAGAYSAQNKEYLERETGGKASSTDLYLAHFLGAKGAAQFISARHENPGAAAADILPQAARANKNVFFDKATGQARSLDQVYALFAQKFAGGTQIASTKTSDRATPPSPPSPGGVSSTPPSSAGNALVRAPAAAPALTVARAQAHPSSVAEHAAQSLPSLSRLSPATLMMLLDITGEIA